MTNSILPPSGKRVNHKLTLRQQHQLNGFVLEHYAKLGLTDGSFAEKAASELGFHVTGSNVAGVRNAFEIPSTREVQRSVDPSTLEGRIAHLERIVAALEQRIQVYLDGCRKDRSNVTGG